MSLITLAVLGGSGVGTPELFNALLRWLLAAIQGQSCALFCWDALLTNWSKCKLV